MHVATGAVLGILLGIVAGWLADRLPSRYGITHPAAGPRRSRRNILLLVTTTACGAAIAYVLSGVPDLRPSDAAIFFGTHAIACAAVLAAAAIDLEHMILPNELTLGITGLCLLTSPFRSIGLVGSASGALVGLAVSYLPLFLYKRLRGQTGMGVGDGKLALLAGAWLGIEGVLFVILGAAVQNAFAGATMRAFRLTYPVPESVEAELRDLRARAAAGDEEARAELAEDPMAAEARDGVLQMRLPLGPFLALACIETLFFRKWLHDHVVAWLLR